MAHPSGESEEQQKLEKGIWVMSEDSEQGDHEEGKIDSKEDKSQTNEQGDKRGGRGGRGRGERGGRGGAGRERGRRTRKPSGGETEDGDIMEEDVSKYAIRKRVPMRLPCRANDIYVCRNSRFSAQLDRAQRLLDSGWKEVYVHGLGAAVSHAINLALQLKARGMGTVDVETTTSTVELIDDLYPTTEDGLLQTRIRYNSAIHIRVFKTDPALAMGLPRPAAQ
eukprot:comp31629_c0_seq1/m.47258 comp31629_c0_seq1/g.47258  ORF comp31629_c0_seq1/g.47258 comp31629_c0_seq1/m.47258 type:complete len:223 (-) comp31629_c0_seq1:583-1251(-)